MNYFKKFFTCCFTTIINLALILYGVPPIKKDYEKENSKQKREIKNDLQNYFKLQVRTRI